MIDINIIQTNYIIHKEGYITNKKTNKILSASLNRKGGYYYVKIKYLDKWIGISIHRLVALAYIPNPNNLEEVNHIDRNRLNNNINNLEWSSRVNNMRHSYEDITGCIKLDRLTRNEKSYILKTLSKDNTKISCIIKHKLNH